MRRGSINEPVDHPDGNAERNPNFKQPIGYAIILNPFTKKIFAYQRSIRDQEYSEKRLQGKWSWGIGGHIEPSDIKGNPIRESLLREIEEEVYLKEGLYGKPKVLGYIYHDFGIHKVHFGILYLVKTSGNVIPKGEMSQGRFMTLKELEEICLSKDCEVEEWSKTALEQLRKLL
jgi:predicted NUDIX family phosphoesterase